MKEKIEKKNNIFSFSFPLTQQVDANYTKILHPKEYSWASKHNRSKSNQNSIQPQSTLLNKSDFNDIRNSLYGKVTNAAQEPRGESKINALLLSI